MAATSFEKQIIELKDTIITLNKTMATLQASLDAANAREEEHLRKERLLQEQIDYLKNKLFGTSSEKRNAPMEGQLSFFDDVEDEAATDGFDIATTPADDKETVSFTRKKKSRQMEKFKDLPVTKKIIDIPEDERICDKCGSPLTRVGEEFLRRELHFIPAKVKIIEYYSVTYECRPCKSRNKIPHIVKARDGHRHMIHGMASASTVAWVIYQKYCNSIPLYRQEKDWKLYGCDLDRTTLAKWVINNSEEFFKPMCEYFKRHILSRPYAMADETPLQVLHEKGRDATSKSYMWVFRTGEFLDKPAIVFIYAPSRAGKVAEKFFRGYTGYLMCDGFSGYNAVGNIKRTGCFAHARRYLLDAVPPKGRMDLSIPAMQGVLYIDKLFDLEEKIHRVPRSNEQIKKLRLKDEKPVLEALWSWADKQFPEKGTKFYKAIVYLRNQRPYLETYLEDGGCSFSNNASERCCKDYVTGRKNWLFSNSTEGADASAYAYSIVQTAKANGVNVYHYLNFLLDNAPTMLSTDEELENLAPWNDAVKAEIKERELQAQADPDCLVK